MMRVLVCGGRDITNRRWFNYELDQIASSRFPRTASDQYGNFLYCVTIITGKARGADQLAADWAVTENTGLKEFPADWEKYGKRAGYVRNKQMLDEGRPDLVVAFPGGKGTAMMTKLATEAGVEVIRVGRSTLQS